MIRMTAPKLGLTMTTGVVSTWVLGHGAHVAKGDIVYILTTDKTDAEIESDDEGTLHIVAPLGAKVKPGEVVAYLLGDGEQAPEPAAPTPDAKAAPAAAAPAAAAVHTAPAPTLQDGDGRLYVSPNARRVAAELGVDVRTVRGTGPSGRIVSEDVEAAAAAAAIPTGAPTETAAARSGPVSPLAERLAAQLGLDLGSLTGTGPGGRIRLDDVLTSAPRAAPSTASAAPSSVGPKPGEVIAHTGMRRAIAARMHESLQQMAQLTLVREVEVDALFALRAQLKNGWSERGWVVPSFTDLVIKAVAIGLREHPRLNATYQPDGLVLHEQVDIGMAVSLDGGLVVPVVRDADELPLRALAQVTSSLARRARDGSLGIDDYAGQTFTVTALGAAGIDAFTPVINPPDVAILGVGRIKDGVGWNGDQPMKRRVMTLSLTIDHRVIDGAPGAEFLATVADVLANPLTLVG